MNPTYLAVPACCALILFSCKSRDPDAKAQAETGKTASTGQSGAKPEDRPEEPGKQGVTRRAEHEPTPKELPPGCKPGPGAQCRGADLTEIELPGKDMRGANFRAARLGNADLSGANLSRANLSRANLKGADLSFADLSGADLSAANLQDANLSSANLTGTNLMAAITFGVETDGTIWAETTCPSGDKGSTTCRGMHSQY